MNNPLVLQYPAVVLQGLDPAMQFLQKEATSGVQVINNQQLTMFYKSSILLIVASFVLATAFSQKVYVIPALHSLHKTNEHYTYDHLKAIVQKLKPDVIAVEIRSEDIASDTSYLKKNYPYEMWMMRYWFPTTPIEGFDWLGTELEGKTIPERYWQSQSHIKTLERQLQADSTFTKKLKACDVYTEERMKTLQHSSLKDILQSNESIFVKEYYNCLYQHMQNSDYEELSRFYDLRNQKMEEQISALVNRHPGKRIVLITGADHYPYFVEYLQKQKVDVLKPV